MPSQIFDYIERAAETHESGEFTFQPMVQQMINDGFNYYGREIVDGTFYDTGDKLEYLKTVLDFALMHDELGGPVRDYLAERLQR